MKSAASERGRYRAAVRDYAEAYNRKHPNSWWMRGRCSFPNLHLRRKWPGWLRSLRRERAPYAERKMLERKCKLYGRWVHTTLDDTAPLSKRELRQRREAAIDRARIGGRGDQSLNQEDR